MARRIGDAALLTCIRSGPCGGWCTPGSSSGSHILDTGSDWVSPHTRYKAEPRRCAAPQLGRDFFEWSQSCKRKENVSPSPAPKPNSRGTAYGAKQSRCLFHSLVAVYVRKDFFILIFFILILVAGIVVSVHSGCCLCSSWCRRCPGGGNRHLCCLGA